MSKKVVNGKIPFTTFKIINYYKKDSIYYFYTLVSRPSIYNITSMLAAPIALAVARLVDLRGIANNIYYPDRYN